MFNSSDGLHPEDESLNDSVMLEIMEERNPDLYKFLMEQAESPEEEIEEPKVVSQGFLAIEMDEPMPEQMEEPIEQEREEII